ncbi:hypothetical protein EYZ11_008657 [Aspergillus tanneri]|nr:hypothetical protein EYZ11_008657 [Aspergillus tanneri]
MFVYRREDLPPEPEFPAQLDKLGYFINDKDQIRKISHPDHEFQFKINKNPRWNEMQREAMNNCVRNIISSRLRALSLTTLKLPLLSTPGDAHVPILVSSNLSTASRIIVVFGEPSQDLGVWAYRSTNTDGIDIGSAVCFARAVLHPEAHNLGANNAEASASESESTPASGPGSNRSGTALIIANTGQLIWHCGSQRAVTLQTWLALPRASAVDPPLTMTRRNKIPGNTSWQEHIDCVFDEVLAAGSRLIREDATIQVVGLVDGGLGAIRYLASRWETWHTRLSSICLSNPLHFTHIDLVDDDNNDSGSDAHPSAMKPTPFASFISTRCRAYVLSNQPLGLPVRGFQDHGCNCYSSGEELNVECIMPRAWKHMLAWLDLTYSDPEYCESRFEVREFSEDLVSGDVEVEEVIDGDEGD